MAKIFKFVPLLTARRNFSKIVRQVEKQDGAIAFTKKGVPVAVILSVDRLEGLLETLNILSDEKTAQSLRKSIRQAQRGRWVGYDKVFGRRRVAV